MANAFLTTKEQIHSELSIAAAKIANQEIQSAKYARFFGREPGEVFSDRSTKGTLSIGYDESLLLSYEMQTDSKLRQRFIKTMQKVAVDAFQQALIENKDDFVGVILGEARKSHNYFDEPPNSVQHTQLNLF